MKKHLLPAVFATLLGVASTLPGAAPAAPLYANDFERLPEGPPPDDLLVLSGTFAIKAEGGGKHLEAAGAPVESCGILIGPETPPAAMVEARIRSAATGKRTPEFGIGLGGAAGYRLWLMPAIGELQLVKGDGAEAEVKTAIPYEWKSGSWTKMQLRLRPAGGKWIIEGKAWDAAAAEPAEWMLKIEDPAKPPEGRALISVSPYSEQPTAFDDLRVLPAQQ